MVFHLNYKNDLRIELTTQSNIVYFTQIELAHERTHSILAPVVVFKVSNCYL